LPRLKPGTVLLREDQGKRLTVAVVPTGYLWRETAYASLLQFSPPILKHIFRDQNKAGHGAVSFGSILGANRMAVIAPHLRQLLAHTGVAIHDLSGGRDGRR
jgi:hypothetical protein